MPKKSNSNKFEDRTCMHGFSLTTDEDKIYRTILNGRNSSQLIRAVLMDFCEKELIRKRELSEIISGL